MFLVKYNAWNKLLDKGQIKGMTKKALKDITGISYLIGENVSTKVEKGLSEGYYTYILYYNCKVVVVDS